MKRNIISLSIFIAIVVSCIVITPLTAFSGRDDVRFASREASSYCGDGSCSVKFDWPSSYLSTYLCDFIKGLVNYEPRDLQEQVDKQAKENAAEACQETIVGTACDQFNRFLSYKVESYAMFEGAAHGSYNITVGTFDIARNRRVTLEEIFFDTYTELVPPLLEKYLPIDSEDVINPEALVPTENFHLSEEGVIWEYNPYEVSFWANGVVSVLVPWDDLQPCLRQYIKMRL